ncbi:hypothetical protein BGZ58_008524 [Dissophora ornata]|nr:hypothetical protein BGZ58_008524 [Dissophora ornata]
MFVERMGAGDLAPIDRVYLGLLYPRVVLKNNEDDGDDFEKEDVDKNNEPLRSRKRNHHIGPGHRIGSPPLRGPDASIADYAQELEKAETRLNELYNESNWRYASRDFDAERAREEEFKRIADSLLRMAGGSVGVKKNETNMVVIGKQIRAGFLQSFVY